MRSNVLWLVVLGCAAEVTEGGGSSIVATGSTGSVAEVGCAETDNALRFSCALTLDTAAEVTWTLLDGDATVRTWTTPSSTTHVGELWGLAPERTYRWEASSTGGSASGDITTGALPSTLSALTVSTSGTAPDLDAVLVPLACGDFSGLAMVEPGGEVVWYEDSGSSGGVGGTSGVTGFDRTEDGHLVAGVDGERIVEWTPMGEIVREVSGFAHPLHHDLAAAEGKIWALYAEQVDDYIVDGFVVIDEVGELAASWALADHVEVQGTTSADDHFWQQQFPGASDWSHANSIEVEDGLALISFRWLDAVMELPVDPDDGDFGEPLFTLVGQEGGPLAGDLAFTDGGGFVGQHHARWTADGHLSVFDNGTSTSRGLHLDVDLEAGTVSEAESWSLGRSCQVQGSVYDLPDGSVLVTCASEGWVGAFPADGGEASWTLELACSGGQPGQSMARSLPVDW